MNIPHLATFRRLHPPSLTPFSPLTDSGLVPADSWGLDPIRVAAALSQVLDPELHISISDLGLIHSLQLDSAGNISVTLGLTSITCPFARQIGEQTLAALKLVPGVKAIRLQLDPLVSWDPSRATDKARQQYESLFSNQNSGGR